MSSVFKSSLNENRILNSFTVTEEAIVENLGSLDVSKSCGPDNLPAVVLRNCAKERNPSLSYSEILGALEPILVHEK